MTAIEWTHRPGTKGETWNPVTGCTKVSAGCKHCYAERMAKRLQAMGLPQYRDGFAVTLAPDALSKPLHWREPRTVFVNSMSDLFHTDVPDEYIAAVFGVMAATQQHTFIVCTKRAKRMREWFEWAADNPQPDGLGTPDGPCGWPVPNVWLLVSTETQETFDERVPQLLHCPAAVHGVSAEPLLGQIDLCLGQYPKSAPHLEWVIVGSESGPHARPMQLGWAESIRDQCAEGRVPFFTKQIANANDRKGGDPQHWPGGPWPREWPEEAKR